MPDNIVPLVRRPVRRVSATAGETKAEIAGVRKLSIGGDSNARISPEKHTPSTTGLRRTWTPPKKEVARPEKKSMLSDEPLPPPPQAPTYEVPENKSGFPPVSKDNLPRLPVAKNRVQKTQVSCPFVKCL